MDLHEYLSQELQKEEQVVQPPEQVTVRSIADYLHNELHKTESVEPEDRSTIKPDTLKEYFTQEIGTSEEDLAVTAFPVKWQQNVDNDNKPVAFDDFMGIVSADALRNTFNPSSKYVTNYLLLDTANTPIMIDNYRAQWGVNCGEPMIQAGVINVNYPIYNIVSMRMATMQIRATGNAYTLFKNFLTTVLIEEFITQSCISQENTRYHFIGTLRTDLRTLEVVFSLGSVIAVSFYEYGNGIYAFKKPITNIDKITLRLFNQFQAVVIPTQVMAVLELVSERVTIEDI